MNDRDEQLKKLLRGSNHNIYGMIEAINALFPLQGVCVDCFYIDESQAYCSFHDDFLFIPELSCIEFKPKKSPTKANKSGKSKEGEMKETFS